MTTATTDKSNNISSAFVVIRNTYGPGLSGLEVKSPEVLVAPLDYVAGLVLRLVEDGEALAEAGNHAVGEPRGEGNRPARLVGDEPHPGSGPSDRLEEVLSLEAAHALRQGHLDGGATHKSGRSLVQHLGVGKLSSLVW